MKYKVKLVSGFAIVIVLLWSSSAVAVLHDMDLQTQLQWRSLELKTRDGALSSVSGLTTNYSLALRQPISPWVTLSTNLSINSLANADEFGKQQNSTMAFNLSSSERTHSLTMGYVRNGYRSVLTSGGQLAVSTGNDRSYDLNFFMREPAFPSFNFQLRRRMSEFSSPSESSSSQNTSWLVGTYYEMAPFRFSLDQGKQITTSTGGPASSTLTDRRMAVNFDQRILSGLNISGELSKDWSTFHQANLSEQASTNSVRSMRITAAPTSAIIINADVYTRDSSQRFSGITTLGSSSGSNISMRSEILPGLAFSITKAHDLRTDVNRQGTSDNTSASLSAVLAPDVLLSLTHSSVRQSVEPLSISSTSTSKSTGASLRLPTGIGMDLSLDVGTSASSGSIGSSFKSQFAAIALRGSLSSDANAGLTYRRSNFSTSGLSVTHQTTDSLDLDLSWLPTSSVGIDAIISYYLNTGTNISEHISPSVDIRWTPDTRSSLYARFDFSRSRQWDAFRGKFIDNGDRGISLGLNHDLSTDSTLGLIYDFQGSDVGDLEWQRTLQLLFTYRL